MGVTAGQGASGAGGRPGLRGRVGTPAPVPAGTAPRGSVGRKGKPLLVPLGELGRGPGAVGNRGLGGTSPGWHLGWGTRRGPSPTRRAGGVGAPSSRPTARPSCKTRAMRGTTLSGISGCSGAGLSAASPAERCLLLNALRLTRLWLLGFLCWFPGRVQNQQVRVCLVHTAFVGQPFSGDAGLDGDSSFPVHSPRT